MDATFATVDYLVLFAYLIGTVGIGLYFWRNRRPTAAEFTTGGRNLSGWLCGLSIFATFLSSITFLALPGMAFDNDWNFFVFSLTLPIAAWIAARWFLPYYRNNQDASAFAMFERRFGLWARWMASLLFLLVQLARMAFVTYLMALPLGLVFQWDIRLLIVITGLIVIFYAAIGGIVAVIWADAIQAVVLTVGAVVALVAIVNGLPNGISDVWQAAFEPQPSKFSLGTFDWKTWKGSAFWMVFAYGLFENIRNFGVDQNYIQRYVSARPKDAVWSLWFGALMYVPISALFLLIGTSLFAFYQYHPADLREVRQIVRQQRSLSEPRTSPSIESLPDGKPTIAENENDFKLGDRVFPHYIAKYLPAGVKGLLIAAIFSAAMSTISTSLNSVATIALSDFYMRSWDPNATEAAQLHVLRTATVVAGLMSVGGAIALVSLSGSALDNWWSVSSVLGTGVLGLFCLGRLSKQADWLDATIGLLVGLMIVVLLMFGQPWLLGSVLFDVKLSIVVGTVSVVLVGGGCSVARHMNRTGLG
ncbi:MAG: sodium:solute symporter [Planctomycetaceae bacterium]|nr:sodium:solute symporter [Planctomycetaceae bacterium]